MTYRPSAVLRLPGSLRISNNKFLRANKKILILILNTFLQKHHHDQTWLFFNYCNIAFTSSCPKLYSPIGTHCVHAEWGGNISFEIWIILTSVVINAMCGSLSFVTFINVSKNIAKQSHSTCTSIQSLCIYMYCFITVSPHSP